MFLCLPYIYGINVEVSDVEGSKYKNELLWLEKLNLMNVDISLKEYKENVSRGSFIQLVYDLFAGKDKENNYNIVFDDVSTSDNRYNAIAWSYNKGIISGRNLNIFAPNDPIRLEEVLIILGRLNGFELKTLPKDMPWYYYGLAWANENNIVYIDTDLNQFISMEKLSSLLYQYYYLDREEMGKKANSLILVDYGYNLLVRPEEELSLIKEQGIGYYELLTEKYKGYHIETEGTLEYVCVFTDEYYKEVQRILKEIEIENLKLERFSYLKNSKIVSYNDLQYYIMASNPLFTSMTFEKRDNIYYLVYDLKLDLLELKKSFEIMNKEIEVLRGKSLQDIIFYITDKLNYNYDAVDNKNLARTKNFITSAVIRNSVVCGGYSSYSMYLLNKLGYPCIYVMGSERLENGELKNTTHAWNLIYVDGRWRKYDITWTTRDRLEYMNMNEKSDNYEILKHPEAIAMAKLLLVDVRV